MWKNLNNQYPRNGQRLCWYLFMQIVCFCLAQIWDISLRHIYYPTTNEEERILSPYIEKCHLKELNRSFSFQKQWKLLMIIHRACFQRDYLLVQCSSNGSCSCVYGLSKVTGALFLEIYSTVDFLKCFFQCCEQRQWKSIHLQLGWRVWKIWAKNNKKSMIRYN